ncbi:MAG TPA: sugar transferase [Candidatus Kryptonia bacterium]|nr:sugar transferase [Candidatus Kryptonia bacterium]
MKRFVDFALSLLGVLFLLPLMALVAAVIKLDSSGPIFFRQRRVGLNGRLFEIYKFRTMVDGAYQMGSRLTTKRDPRVTRVGQILRWFKIDELPQLLNVLRGEMSLIGPRPEDPYFVKFYTPAQRAVLSTPPGIVGPSQILGRDELESYPEGLKDTERYYVEHILPEKLERDLEYVRNASFGGDVRLLVHGLWATIRGAIKTKYLWRRRKRIALMGADLALCALSYWLAVLIRYEGDWPDDPSFAIPPLLIILLVRPVALMYYGAYQGVPAYFGLSDVVALCKAASLSAVISAGMTFLVGLQRYPRSVFAIDWALVCFLLGGLRYGLRGWVRREVQQRRPIKQKAIIVGAGSGGEQISRMLLEDPLSPYRPIGFIDETPERWGSLIHGVRVLGGSAELPLALSANGVKAVFVCLSDLDDGMVHDVMSVCERTGVDYRIVPTLTDLLNTDVFTVERPGYAPQRTAMRN